MLDPTLFSAFEQAYPQLAGLPRHFLEQIQQQAEPFHTPANQVLFEPHSTCHVFLLLLKGSIRVIKASDTERELLLYRLQPGDSCILSVACLLGNTPYSAQGIAESELQGLLLSRVLFRSLLENSSGFREFIFQFFSKRIAQLMSLLNEIAFHPLEQRLASLLLTQKSPFETTHQHLADELGSVREVISRILKHFEEQGAIHLERGLIHISDRSKLLRIAKELCDLSH